jgi:hypothetical protein
MSYIDEIILASDEESVVAAAEPVSEVQAESEPSIESRKISFSTAVEQSLKDLVSAHNKTFGTNIAKRADIRAVRAVYRRGAGGFTAGAALNYSRDAWAKARVSAFLNLLASGRPSNASYTSDNDLLPAAHPKSAKRNAESLAESSRSVQLAASNSLVASIKSVEEFQSPEHAIFALAEYSGLGYDLIPAVRAVWNRAESFGDNPFERAFAFVTNLYSSPDADLLPKQENN